LLTGAPRPVEVVAVTPAAVYVATGDPDTPALCLCLPDAVRVPCALVLPPGAALPRLACGDGGRLGAGEFRLPGLAVRPARWWRVPRPHRVTLDHLTTLLTP